MGAFRKQWTWPVGLADKVYTQIRKWDNQYNNTGRIFKSRAIANARYGMDVPDTKVLVRMHELTFTYSEIKWLAGILHTEDPGTSQAVIFAKAQEVFEEKQSSGRVVAGMALPFEMALTHDEVKYIRMLLECIGLYRKPTPSEKVEQAKGVAKADW
jgi:hypothetical protein